MRPDVCPPDGSSWKRPFSSLSLAVLHDQLDARVSKVDPGSSLTALRVRPVDQPAHVKQETYQAKWSRHWRAKWPRKLRHADAMMTHHRSRGAVILTIVKRQSSRRRSGVRGERFRAFSSEMRSESSALAPTDALSIMRFCGYFEVHRNAATHWVGWLCVETTCANTAPRKKIGAAYT